MTELAPSDVLDILDADATAEKRASWEAFEFTLLGNGDVEVINGSYEEPDEHTYTVHVEGGIPATCTCPAWEYQEGPCKHQVAVAIRKPLLEAVTAEPRLKADGGVIAARDEETDEERECDCTEFSDFPCWPCYRTGRKELPK